jgi:inosine-uridine nucleoside N-ribohydrolase
VLKGADLTLASEHLRTSLAGFLQWDNRIDFNVQFDSTYARLLYAQADLTLVPIEVTAQTFLRLADHAALRSSGPTRGTAGTTARMCFQARPFHPQTGA